MLGSGFIAIVNYSSAAALASGSNLIPILAENGNFLETELALELLAENSP